MIERRATPSAEANVPGNDALQAKIAAKKTACLSISISKKILLKLEKFIIEVVVLFNIANANRIPKDMPDKLIKLDISATHEIIVLILYPIVRIIAISLSNDLFIIYILFIDENEVAINNIIIDGIVI